MALLNYIIWTGSPEIFPIGSFSLRWYGLFFALTFLIGQYIFYYIYRKEGKPEKDVDTITIYMVIATILGARLGHVIFYQSELIWTAPWSIILPFEFSPFRFTGLQGLASHGAAIGILLGAWLFSRKRKPGQNFLQLLDRIVIIVALAGAFIRLGNYFNSEIVGKPTDKPYGVVFTNDLTEYIESKQVDKDGIVESVAYMENDTVPKNANGSIGMLIYIFFKPNATELQIDELINGRIKNHLSTNREHFDQEVLFLLPYETANQGDGSLAARIKTYGIPRHPAQLYESISCVFLFLLLFVIWNKYKTNLPQGSLFGLFLIICFGLRFFYEFLKENQADFESTLPINMGQILSIPLVLTGMVVMFLAFKNHPKEKDNSALKN
jgi:prolipoprotein diacylglyceryltransferase